MEKIFDKLGIYDLFVNLLTGTAMIYAFLFLNKYLFKICMIKNIFANIWSVLLLGYFVGIVFQEASNFIESILYRINYHCIEDKTFRFAYILWFVPSIHKVLMTEKEIENYCGKNKLNNMFLKKKPKHDLDDNEIKGIREFADKANNLNLTIQNNDMIYRYCQMEAQRSGNLTRYTNDQSHASMARSSALYCFVIFMFDLHHIIVNGMCNFAALIAIISLALFLLFLRRNKRFSEMRYINIFRSCIY